MRLNEDSLRSVFNALIPWYIKFSRNLPWRSNPLPYHVWLSEIVFQQTRIEQGLPYYEKIINRFPDVYALANAHEDDLLRLWQGLGYYSRALNLHKAAKKIVNDYNGEFPESIDKIKSLPGVGPYTAAAVASIAFEQPVAVFDGNVRRITGRIFCIPDPEPKLITSVLERIIVEYTPSRFNQSMMELGALVCKPKSPDCVSCPVKQYCCVFKKGKVGEFPEPKRKTAKQKLHFIYFQIFRKDIPGEFALIKRSRRSIWKGLYEFPSITSSNVENVSEAFKRAFPGLEITSEPLFLRNSRHELTHKSITADFYAIHCKGDFPDNWEWYNEKSASEKGMHKLMFEFFK
ncbi:MAG: A/G-specific adenine glycosylase [Marinilabiliales bacterium]|nr:MAG: A/G-specific adenine glycosylase [Marinilabiliales bacterium]